MSFAQPEGPPVPELSTTRIAGGTSARVVALAVAGVLIGVAGFAVINRPPAPAAPVTAGPVAAASTPAQTPAPTPSPPRHQPEGSDRPGTTTPRIYHYAASMVITGGLLRTALEPQLEDDYTGVVVIESADVGASIELEVGRQWSEGGLQIFESFDSWNIALKRLRRSRGGQVELLTAHVPPAPAHEHGPPAAPIATGYTFTVLGRRDGTQLMLFFDLVWPVASQLET
jgi:hypothetical protein